MSAPVRCAVLGRPIAHSLSPALHRAAYAALGLDGWSYERVEMDEAGLAGFVAGCDSSWRGLSLTMPLKVVALGLGEVEPLAALVGAANTLVFTHRGRHVHNTDVGGLVAAVRRVADAAPGRVTILGSGATARSALVSAAQLGAGTVTVVARSPAKAEVLREVSDALDLRLEVLPWEHPLPATDVLISTVTAGAADSRAEELAASAAVVFDAVYDPWPTPLAAAGAAAGRTVLNGLDLLVGQAVLQIELMTGREISPDLLLAAGQAELAVRSGQRPAR
jgi:shikimate dehydrogenase